MKRTRIPRRLGEIDLSHSTNCDGSCKNHEARGVGIVGKPHEVGLFPQFVSQCCMNNNRNIDWVTKHHYFWFAFSFQTLSQNC